MEHTIQDDNKLHNSSTAAFWATLLFIVLLITALNFVNSNSGNHEEHTPTTEHNHAQPTAAENTTPTSGQH